MTTVTSHRFGGGNTEVSIDKRHSLTLIMKRLGKREVTGGGGMLALLVQQHRRAGRPRGGVVEKIDGGQWTCQSRWRTAVDPAEIWHGGALDGELRPQGRPLFLYRRNRHVNVPLIRVLRTAECARRISTGCNIPHRDLPEVRRGTACRPRTVVSPAPRVHSSAYRRGKNKLCTHSSVAKTRALHEARPILHECAQEPTAVPPDIHRLSCQRSSNVPGVS